MTRLFISYARPSLGEVETLAQDLRDLGHTVWFDQHLVGGTPWWSRILEAIRESDGFIYAVSPAAAQSPACRRELQYAEDLGLHILPVQVQGASLSEHPSAIQRLQVIDYVAPGRAHAVALARAVAAIPPLGSLPDPLPQPPAPPVQPLAELRELATQEAAMSFEAQSAWVMRARSELKASSAADEVALLALVEVFRKRKDLYAVVAEELGAMSKPRFIPTPAPRQKPAAASSTSAPVPGQQEQAPRRAPAARAPSAAPAAIPGWAAAKDGQPPSQAPAAPASGLRIDRRADLGKYLLVGTLPGLALILLAWMLGVRALPFWIPEGFAFWIYQLGSPGLWAFLALGAGLVVFATWAFVADEIILIDAGEPFLAALKGSGATAVIAYSVAGGAAPSVSLPPCLLAGFALHVVTLWISIYRYTPGASR